MWPANIPLTQKGILELKNCHLHRLNFLNSTELSSPSSKWSSSYCSWEIRRLILFLFVDIKLRRRSSRVSFFGSPRFSSFPPPILFFNNRLFVTKIIRFIISLNWISVHEISLSLALSLSYSRTHTNTHTNTHTHTHISFPNFIVH